MTKTDPSAPGRLARAALEPRLLRPVRPRFADAQAATRELDAPADAWETLATRGLVPIDWVDRTFLAVCDRCVPLVVDYGVSRRPPCSACGGRGRRLLSAPPSVEACVAIASDPHGVATAEALLIQMAHVASSASSAVEPWVDRFGRIACRVSEQAIWRFVPATHLPAARRHIRSWLDSWTSEPYTPSLPLDLLAAGYAFDSDALLEGDAVVLLVPGIEAGAPRGNGV